MILAHGADEVFENKAKIIRYKFFTNYAVKHGDGIYGIDRPLIHAFNFHGELNMANRGLVEFLEALRFDVTDRNDRLGAAQADKIKTREFAQTNMDEGIPGDTNEPEYRRLQNNEFMEALRDRTVKIDIPYVMRLKDEIKIDEKDSNPNQGKEIAPHTTEFAAMWAAWRARSGDGGYARHQRTQHPGQDHPRFRPRLGRGSAWHWHLPAQRWGNHP